MPDEIPIIFYLNNPPSGSELGLEYLNPSNKIGDEFLVLLDITETAKITVKY